MSFDEIIQQFSVEMVRFDNELQYNDASIDLVETV